MARRHDDGIPVLSTRKRQFQLRVTIFAISFLAVAFIGAIGFYYYNRQPNNPEVVFERWQQAGRNGDWSKFFDLMDEGSQFILTRSIERAIEQDFNSPSSQRYQGLKGKALFMQLVADKRGSGAITDVVAAYLVAPVVGVHVNANGKFADIDLQMPRSNKTTTIYMKWQSGGWRIVCAFLM